MLGGSVWTTDHTCGRREAVEECGEQPREPRGKRARQNGSQGEKGRNGSKRQRGEKKATPYTLSFTFQPQQQPQQHLQQQQHQRQRQSRRRGSSDAPTTGALKLKELVTKGELLFPDVKDFLTKFEFVNAPCRREWKASRCQPSRGSCLTGSHPHWRRVFTDNNNNNTIWGGSVLTGEEPPPHSGELKHALPQAGGPTQSQLSRPMPSGHHSSMEHRLRRKQLNSDTNASNRKYLKAIQEKRKEETFSSEK